MILDNGLVAFLTRPWTGIISTLPDTYSVNKFKLSHKHIYTISKFDMPDLFLGSNLGKS